MNIKKRIEGSDIVAMDANRKNFTFYEFFLMAFINLSFLLSSRAFCKEITAQIAAGIQPKMVICRMRQIIPVRILPRKMNDKAGNKMAIKVMINEQLFRLR